MTNPRWRGQRLLKRLKQLQVLRQHRPRIQDLWLRMR